MPTEESRIIIERFFFKIQYPLKLLISFFLIFVKDRNKLNCSARIILLLEKKLTNALSMQNCSKEEDRVRLGRKTRRIEGIVKSVERGRCTCHLPEKINIPTNRIFSLRHGTLSPPRYARLLLSLPFFFLFLLLPPLYLSPSSLIFLSDGDSQSRCFQTTELM